MQIPFSALACALGGAPAPVYEMTGEPTDDDRRNAVLRRRRKPEPLPDYDPLDIEPDVWETELGKAIGPELEEEYPEDLIDC